jgi:predicted ATPase
VAHLWERDEVTGALLGAVATAATGAGSVSFIVGEAGLGKTSLVRLLQEGFDELSVVEGLASAEMRAAFYYRTARWVEKTVADEPLLVLVDDLHWADPDSLGLLGSCVGGWRHGV